jgi:hypothetical protein
VLARSLMKKMKERQASGPNLLQKAGLAAAPKELEEACAFSILAKERSLDFVAPSEAVRDAWLANLSLLLVSRATLDGTAAVMGRDDVLGELRAMSADVARLKRQQAAAMTRQRSFSAAGRQSARAARASGREPPVLRGPREGADGQDEVEPLQPLKQGALFSGFM